MLIDFGSIIILCIWIIVCFKNAKIGILSLPYLIIFFITPIYNILDQLVFVKEFGCGCKNLGHINAFNIEFNANDLRRVVYSILIIINLVLGIFLSKNIKRKILKIIYVITIFIFNILLSLKICKIYMWL